MTYPDWAKGIEKIDSPNDMYLNIRASDIENAEANNGYMCVAARCIARAFAAERVYVYKSKTIVQFDEGGPIYRFQNSHALVRNVIDVLDNPHLPNSAIKPGLYLLRAPTPAQALGKDRTPKNPGTRKPRKDRGRGPIGRISASFVGQ